MPVVQATELSPTLMRASTDEAPTVERPFASQAPTVPRTLPSEEALTQPRPVPSEALTVPWPMASEPPTVATVARAHAPGGTEILVAPGTTRSSSAPQGAAMAPGGEDPTAEVHPPHVAYAATVLSPADNFPTLTGPPATAPSRSTVLPRVELIGDEPTLIVEGKRRYEDVRPLGKGGLGEVVGAQDNDIGRTVAVKRLRPDMQTPSTLVRFVEEIRMTGRLEHPNIVPIHDVGLDEEGHYYFVMKYVDGETLETIIEKLVAGDVDYHRRFTFERRVQLFMSILDAMAFAHCKGILHRDIKPANVMVGAHGEVMVMDWGIARSLREPSPGDKAEALMPLSLSMAGALASGRAFETQIGTLIGTPAYMSPEQASGRPTDERSDVYSLCVLFYELLTLQHPVPRKETLTETLAAVIQDEAKLAPLLKSPHQGRVPADLGWFLRPGLSKDPTKRYASVGEMRERLLRRAERDIPVECPVTFMKQMSNRFTRVVDRHPFVMMILMFGGGLLAAGMLIYQVLA